MYLWITTSEYMYIYIYNKRQSTVIISLEKNNEVYSMKLPTWPTIFFVWQRPAIPHSLWTTYLTTEFQTGRFAVPLYRCQDRLTMEIPLQLQTENICSLGGSTQYVLRLCPPKKYQAWRRWRFCSMTRWRFCSRIRRRRRRVTERDTVLNANNGPFQSQTLFLESVHEARKYAKKLCSLFLFQLGKR